VLKERLHITTILTYPQQESTHCQQLRFNSIDAIIARDNVSLLYNIY